jgi:hypothetical protein
MSGMMYPSVMADAGAGRLSFFAIAVEGAGIPLLNGRVAI